MKWLKHLLVAWGVAVLGLMGGQGRIGGKAPRRFGIPVFILAMGNFSKKTLPFLLLMPILAIGYGESSWISSYFSNQEWIVRLAYAFLLSLPFLFYGIKRWLWAVVTLVAAFQVRAGSLGHVGFWGDILAEDLCRYLILGILVSYNLFVRNN